MSASLALEHAAYPASVIPAQAGIQTTTAHKYKSTARISTVLITAHINTSAIDSWIPACAGMTGSVRKQGW